MKKLRPLIFAIIFLIITDLLLRLPIFPIFSEDFRIPKVTLMGYDEYIQYMKKQPGVRVAVIGDSVIEGLFVNSNETMPYYLNSIYQSQSRQVKVFNLGISAAHANDLFAVMSKLSSEKDVDLVVVNFNYPFYAAGDNNQTRRYPELYRKVGDFAPFNNAPFLNYQQASDNQNNLEDTITKKVKGFWQLYKYRDYLDAVIFHGAPAEIMKNDLNNRINRFITKKLAVSKLKVNQFNVNDLKKRFNVPPFSKDNIQINYFEKILQKAKHDGMKVVVINGPINFQVLDYYKVLNHKVYEQNIAYVKNIVEENGGVFINLADNFPEEYIADSVHPFKEGYKVMAERTAKGIEPIIQAEESSINKEKRNDF